MDKDTEIRKVEDLSKEELEEIQKETVSKYFTYLFIFVLGIFVMILVYLLVRSAPLLEKVNNQKEVVTTSGLKDADISNIVYEDSYNQYGYVNNRVLIYFSDNATEAEIDKVVKFANADIVGNIMDQYELQVSPMTKDELKDLLKNIEEFDCVDRTNLVIVLKKGN